MERFDALREALDLTPLAETISQMMWADRIDAQLRGQDGFGQPLEALAASTLKKRKGSGWPLSPFDGSSRVVTNYSVEILPISTTSILLSGTWEGIPWLIYHLEGDGHLPVRDIAHVRPETWERIGEAVHDFCQTLLAGGRFQS